MKKFAVYMIIFSISMLVFVGCNQPSTDNTESLIIKDENQTEETTDTSTESSENAKITIALVMKTLTNPFFVEMEKGARQAEKELGINLLVKTGAQETSIEQQISIIQSLIDEEVAAIVIAPADSKELIPVLKEAQDAGIVIINIDNQLNPEISQEMGLLDVPYISVNNEQGAYLSAKYISDQITEPTQVAILEGIRSAQNAQDRKNGALRAFGENSNIEVVTMETANWQIDEAHDVIAEIYDTYPDIKAVFCANDMMAFGVIQYLKETAKPDVLVAAYDALDEAKEAIRDGTLQSTIDQQAALQAYTGVQFAIQALNGQKLPPQTLVDVKLINSQNVND